MRKSRQSEVVRQSDPGVMTTFSVRLWEGQKQRIEDSAMRANKSTPEWILDLLMPATAKVLGDSLPEFPPVKRRPERTAGRRGAPDATQKKKIEDALTGVDPKIAQLVRTLLQTTTSGPHRG